MKNLTLLTDLYQLTMINGYFENNVHNDVVVFDMFFRKNACKGGYTIVCGIEQLVEYIENLKFSESDLDYLKTLNLFSDKFLDFLRDFKFTGDIYTVFLRGNAVSIAQIQSNDIIVGSNGQVYNIFRADIWEDYPDQDWNRVLVKRAKNYGGNNNN